MAGEARRTAGASAEYREMPANLDAEQALLGAIFIRNSAYGRASEYVTEEMFHEDLHRRIWHIMKSLLDKGQAATPVIVKGYLGDQDLGGVTVSQYLASLAAKATTVANADSYARTIRELYFRRLTIARLQDALEESFNAPVESSAETIINKVIGSFSDMRPNPKAGQDFEPFEDVSRRWISALHADWRGDTIRRGLSSGYPSLDGIIGALEPPDLIILGARPSVGKTALGLNIAYNIAYDLRETARTTGEDQGVVGVFSLEMSAEQLSLRIMSAVSGIASWRLKRPAGLSQNEVANIVNMERDMASLPLVIDETAKITIAQLEVRARRLHKQKRLRFLMIDYLQLVGTREKGRSREENRNLELAEITSSLKALAKELQIPIMALAQLSRKVDDRPIPERRPVLSDLRESGSIENDADLVMFIYREEYYLKNIEPKAGTERHAKWQSDMRKVEGHAEVIVAKQRQGKTGTVRMGFDGDKVRFVNDPPPVPPDAPPPEGEKREKEPPQSMRIALNALGVLRKAVVECGQESRGDETTGVPRGVRFVPYDVWRERVIAETLDTDTDDKAKSAHMKTVTNTLMYKQLIVRGGNNAAYVWLASRSH